MRRIEIAVRILLAIALAGLGLPCRACRREGDDDELVAIYLRRKRA